MLLKGSHSTASTEVKVGDIVLIKENLPIEEMESWQDL